MPAPIAKSKIKTLRALKDLCDRIRGEGKRIVFTNGCFDLLHVGHIRYLEEARNLGDLLIVAVNSDSSIRKIKGPLRPLIAEEDRIELVAALQCVDFTVLFDTPDPLPIIDLLRPDILVKGADWPLDRIIGADVVLGCGGEVMSIPLVPGISTTMIIDRVLTRFGEDFRTVTRRTRIVGKEDKSNQASEET